MLKKEMLDRYPRPKAIFLAHSDKKKMDGISKYNQCKKFKFLVNHDKLKWST